MTRLRRWRRAAAHGSAVTHSLRRQENPGRRDPLLPFAEEGLELVELEADLRVGQRAREAFGARSEAIALGGVAEQARDLATVGEVAEDFKFTTTPVMGDIFDASCLLDATLRKLE